MTSGNRPGTFPMSFKKGIPNLLTLLNMLAGLLVLHLSICSMGQEYKVPSYLLILAAAALDAFDGRAARLLDAESELGKQLDSFADLVSFGIAPIATLMTQEPFHSTPGILLVLMLYPLAGAFRLARHNLAQYESFFTGLPITAAGMIQACYGLLLTRISLPPGWLVGTTVLLTVVLSILMVANFKVRRIWPESSTK